MALASLDFLIVFIIKLKRDREGIKKWVFYTCVYSFIGKNIVFYNNDIFN